MILLTLLSCTWMVTPVNVQSNSNQRIYETAIDVEFDYNSQHCKVIRIYDLEYSTIVIAKFIDCKSQLINSSYNYPKGKFGI